MSEELKLLEKIHKDSWSAKWYAPLTKMMKYDKIARMVNAYFKSLEKSTNKLVWTKETSAETVNAYFKSLEKEKTNGAD